MTTAWWCLRRPPSRLRTSCGKSRAWGTPSTKETGCGRTSRGRGRPMSSHMSLTLSAERSHLVVAVEAPVQRHGRHAGPGARRLCPSFGAKIRRRAFAGFQRDGAIEPVAIEQTQTLAQQASLRIPQDEFQAASRDRLVGLARQDQRQARDASVRVLRAGERQRRKGDVRRRARLAVSSVAAHPKLDRPDRECFSLASITLTGTLTGRTR